METVGQVYMAVSGAPERTEFHAQNICDVSLSMMSQVKQLQMPSGTKVEVRIGKPSSFPMTFPSQQN